MVADGDQGVSRRAPKTQHPCKSMVDRSGFEPLTSAVQTRQLIC